MSIIDAGKEESTGSLEKLLVLLTDPKEYAKKADALLSQEKGIKDEISKLATLHELSVKLNKFKAALDVRSAELGAQEAELGARMQIYMDKAAKLKSALSD